MVSSQSPRHQSPEFPMSESLIKKPSAYVPIAMSLAALAIVVGHYAVKGMDHDPDEGTPAHLFQLLMVLQLPFIAAFIVRWVPDDTRRGLVVLAAQGAAIIAAFASVYFLT